MAVGGSALLPIEDAGDHGVGIVHGQPTHERYRVLIGAHGLARCRAKSISVMCTTPA